MWQPPFVKKCSYANLSKGGRGPNENDRRSKQHNIAMKQATAFSNELDQMTGNSKHDIFLCLQLVNIDHQLIEDRKERRITL